MQASVLWKMQSKVGSVHECGVDEVFGQTTKNRFTFTPGRLHKSVDLPIIDFKVPWPEPTTEQ